MLSVATAASLAKMQLRNLSGKKCFVRPEHVGLLFGASPMRVFVL